ncbi:MAG: hypothetical protein DMF56_10695 [Acidobacteria bacterium]|nr:MAG: hypothetical protein DMF56_10695 [Acidobacteriota bacterium]
MRYKNPESGAFITLGELSPERKQFFERALKLFRSNASWFAFEQMAFSFYSPLFHGVRNRAEVVNDPLFEALQDMWLQLGINQGFIAPRGSHDRTTETKTRTPDPHSPSVIRDMASPGKSRGARRRRR